MPRITVITPSIRPSGLVITQECLKQQTFTDFEWVVEIGLGIQHDFNQAMNRMIKRANGELIVILQDYIKVDEAYLDRCWNAYKQNKSTLFTCPVGKSNNQEYTDPIKWDWRNNEHAKMDWRMWEIDSGFCAKNILVDIGGFDEMLDEYWSMDNVSVGMRADLLGYKFDVLRSNKCIAYDHDAFIEHPFRKNYRPVMVNAIMDSYKENPRLKYLD